MATLRRLQLGTMAGGWLGGITPGADDPLSQARQRAGHGSELGAEIRILVSQSQVKLSGIARPRPPKRRQ